MEEKQGMNTRQHACQTKMNGSTNGNGRAAANPMMEAFSGPFAQFYDEPRANGHHNGKPAYPADDADALARDALMDCYNG